MLVSGYAAEGCHQNNHKQVGEVGRDTSQTNRNSGDIEIELSGKYEFTVTHNLLQRMEHAQKLSVTWTYNDKKSMNFFHLCSDNFKDLFISALSLVVLAIQSNWNRFPFLSED